MKKYLVAGFVVAIALGVTVASCGSPASRSHNDYGADLPRLSYGKAGAPYKNGRFYNTEQNPEFSLANVVEIIKTQRHSASTPDRGLPIRPIPEQELRISGQDRLYRLGHSSVLLELNQQWVLTDPVFSQRVFPVQWAGPARFDDTPVSIAQLPNITAVVISHSHYDHLDKHSIDQLNDKTAYFVVPLKVGPILERWGVEREKIVELDWWQGVELPGLNITATPAQHYSNRGLLDRNKTLWASYVFEAPQSRVFFSGDTGYFGGFADIGAQFDPFDLSLIEVGAYNDLWSEIHLLPEHAMQAHIELNAAVMVPIHNATFDLGRHAWWEPFEAMEALAAQHQSNVLLPRFGEEVHFHQAEPFFAWWKDYVNPDQAGIN